MIYESLNEYMDLLDSDILLEYAKKQIAKNREFMQQYKDKEVEVTPGTVGTLHKQIVLSDRTARNRMKKDIREMRKLTKGSFSKGVNNYFKATGADLLHNADAKQLAGEYIPYANTTLIQKGARPQAIEHERTHALQFNTAHKLQGKQGVRKLMLASSKDLEHGISATTDGDGVYTSRPLEKNANDVALAKTDKDREKAKRGTVRMVGKLIGKKGSKYTNTLHKTLFNNPTTRVMTQQMRDKVVAGKVMDHTPARVGLSDDDVPAWVREKLKG